jgi:heavy metal sensor kinase
MGEGAVRVQLVLLTGMIFNSIKWRLQIWYGLILVAVLVGFGVTAYQLEFGRQFRRIDDELQRRAGALANALRHAPPPRGPDASGEPEFNRPPPAEFPGEGPSQQELRQPPKFVLPPQDAVLFDANDPNGFYFIINTRDGREIARSTNAPIVEAIWDNRPSAPGGTLPQMGPDFFHPIAVQTFGKIRELIQTLPSGDTIRVGCFITSELKEFHLIILKLAGAGGIILLLGLAGGWWLASRAIRPIEDISAAAVKIAAGDLSQRINTADTETELGRLATVLNSTFARLETTFAQQRQFTSDAAHELRTPVSVILTQAQSALNRERSPAEYRETLEACQRAAQRMRRLIASLLELARFDGGQEKLNRQRFDLAQMARDCVELVGPIADAREVKIQCELPPLECAGDAERLGQVVTNLLTNAIQHNPPGTEVRVKLEAQGNLAALTVADDGAGIPAEDLPRVFERFYQADKSRTGGGAGLGLAISRAVVEAHGGTLEVSSQEGAGTTFVIRLPVG